MNRRGPWTNEEKEFIALNANKLSVDDIAKQIQRDPEAVAQYIKKKLGLRLENKNRLTSLVSGTSIETSFIWPQLRQELTEDELKTFLYHWNRIILQFKEDVFPTEEMQIIDTIKLEIMMSRSLKSQRDSLQRIKDIHDEIKQIKNSGETGPNAEMKLNSMEGRLAAAKSAYALVDKEFNDLLNRKSSMLKELKATRDQRLKRIENSKTTFVGWMSEIITNPSLRRELGVWMEKNRLAAEAEEKRLSQPHKYNDGVYDLPLLTNEVLLKIESEDNEEKQMERTGDTTFEDEL